LALHSDRLMVLSDNSKSTFKSIYGPLTISTGGSDFHFFNTFKKPWVKGNIDILSAHLTMPLAGGGPQSVSSEGIVYRTLPNDSLRRALRGDTSRFGSAREALEFAANAGSVRMTAHDDSVFSNRMKNIYL